ncbi:MAG TPA: hypothetical protein VH419_04835, partial [Nocardioidaceae bacterium]
MPGIDELERGLQPPEDLALGGPDLAAIRGEGRRLRRRRQLLSAGVAAAVTAGVATAALAVPQALDHGDEQTQAAGTVTAPPTKDSDLLERCRNGENSPHAVALLFDPGTPTVEAVSRSPHGVSLAIESADARYWAECHIALKR